MCTDETFYRRYLDGNEKAAVPLWKNMVTH